MLSGVGGELSSSIVLACSRCHPYAADAGMLQIMSFQLSVSRIDYQVVTVPGFHLFPFRTEKLSPAAPMVLQCNVGE